MDSKVGTATTLDTYRLLGRSGLRVSPLSLGGMTFGDDWGWGAGRDETRRIIDSYVERGGNFLDTAGNYTNGSSEKLIGEFTAGRRDGLVIATKYTSSTQPGDPNASGNHRKNLMRSVEQSLRNLRTDYIDLLYLHIWDDTTPIDEVMRGLDDLVAAGKVNYIGISDTPAWQVSRMQTLAELRGWSRFAALQIEYSLAERTVERELIPMGRELGIGVVPWSPLASGVLTGKYTRDDLDVAGGNTPAGTRKDVAKASGALTSRALDIADVVAEVAKETDRTPAQIAVAWTLRNPAVTSPIIGARTLAQLEDNLQALTVDFTAEQLARLEEISAVELGFPHDFAAKPMIQYVIHGGATIAPRV